MSISPCFAYQPLFSCSAVSPYNPPKLVQVLDLRGNRIKRIDGLHTTTSLRRLSLSCNSIADVDEAGLPDTWPALEFFSVYANYLRLMNNVFILISRMPSVSELHVSGNPCCAGEEQVEAAAADIVAASPSVVWIDCRYCGGVAAGLPSAARTADETASFLAAALEEAMAGLEEGGIPIGSVLVHQGQVIGRGHNRRVQSGSPILHGEMDALANAGRQPAAVYQQCTLYTTLSPCAMCTGAVLLYGIPEVVVGENVTFMGEEELLRARGVHVRVLQDARCIAMMNTFTHQHPELWSEDIGV